MRVSVAFAAPWTSEADVLVVPVTIPFGPEMIELDRKVGGTLSAHFGIGDLSAAYSAALVHTGGVGPKWLLAVRLGDPLQSELAAVRLGASVARRLAGLTFLRVALWLEPLRSASRLDDGTLVELVTRGFTEGTYEPRQIYDPEAGRTRCEEFVLVLAQGNATSLEAAANRGLVIGEGTNDTRTLSQRAANDLTPTMLASAAMERGEAYGWSVESLPASDAARLGMGMFAAVAAANEPSARMIVIRTQPQQDGRDPRLISFIGKAVTFDTGGINLKQTDRMRDEKVDKAGGAAVLAALTTISRLGLDQPLLGIIPAVVNVPGSHAVLPGDVVRSLNGTVVEVENTDFEGRLILGDAISYAERLGATDLVIVATMTDSSSWLGDAMISGQGEPQPWWETVRKAAERQGERLFQLPLIADYRSSMSTWFAGLGNDPGDRGAAVKVGLFLREFRTRPWVYLDLSWNVWNREPLPWAALGANGAAHATLVQIALDAASSREIAQ